MTDTTPVLLTVTVQELDGDGQPVGDATELVGAVMHYRYAKRAVVAALDDVADLQAATLAAAFEAANAATVAAAQAPIVAAQDAATAAFAALEAAE